MILFSDVNISRWIFNCFLQMYEACKFIDYHRDTRLAGSDFSR